MTIKSTATYGSDDVGCQWFSGKKLEHGVFDMATLVAATAPEK